MTETPLMAIYSRAETVEIIAQALAACRTLDHGTTCYRSGHECVCEIVARQRVAARAVLTALGRFGLEVSHVD